MSEDESESVKVIVEIPKGSRNKYERNAETGELELDRRLFAAVTYPTEYGYVPDTLSGDGDELDAMVAVTEPTFPGCVIHAKPVAVLRMTSGGEEDPKLLGVPLGDPAWNDLEERDDLPGDLATEIEHFFEAMRGLESKDVEIDGWGSREDAIALVERTRERARKDRD